MNGAKPPNLEHMFAMPIIGGRIKIGMPRNRSSIMIRIKYNSETYKNMWPDDEVCDLTGDCKIRLTCNELYRVWQHALLGAVGFGWKLEENSDKKNIDFVVNWDFLIVTKRRVSMGLPNAKQLDIPDSFFRLLQQKLKLHNGFIPDNVSNQTG